GWIPPGGTGPWLGRHFADLLENDRREVLSSLRAAANAGEWDGRFVVSGRPVSVTLRAVRDDRGNLDAIVGARRSAAGDETGDLFRRIPLGLVLLDESLRIVETNPELAAICGAASLPPDPAGLDIRSLAVFQTRSAQSALEELSVAGEIDLPEVRLAGAESEETPVHFRGGCLRDAAGATTGYVLTLVARTGADEVERHLMRAQKMESIGNLAAGLAHDFGNFIAVILGKAGMLRVKLPSDPHITGDLSDIETAAKRAQHLSQELMRFARGGRNRMTRLDVRKLIDEVGALIRTSVGRKIRVQLRLHEDTPMIRGDEVELQQVIMNLCLNARDAMPNGGTLVIETAPLTEEQRAHLGADVTEGVRLVVSDTGEGIPQDVVDRIFEPFFTTKDEAQRGTGLGLAMVYGTVRRHGGTIDVRSRPGDGTRFEILLPTSSGGGGEPPADARRILVVDDEPAFREMIRLILEEDGHVVDLAANGIEALRTLRADWQSLALVILDLRMPGLDGLGVLEEIRRLTPTLPVLVTTGYAGEEEKEEAVRRGAASVLEKPYRVAQLRAALVTLLEGPQAAPAAGGEGAEGGGPA
ncbi:response regulator, partial [bacterium]|nr:response regulator [bacterium]